MTTPAPGSDSLPPEFLAAYADGELDPAGRAAVERWLANNPAGRSELDAQVALSPANDPFWERAEPPAPAAADWVGVRRGIEHGLTPATPKAPRGRRSRWVLARLTAAGIAASVAWLAFGPPSRDRNREPRLPEVVERGGHDPRPVAVAPAPRSGDPLDEFAVLPIATNDEVVLDRVPDLRAGWLPVGRQPLDGMLVLATVEQLQLAGFDPSPAWPASGPKMTTAPGDAPMIYAAKLR